MAGRISPRDIETLKQRLNIADVVADYLVLKRAGADSMKGLCPFHDERSPSFHVRPSAGFYHCFGCGESGDVISFVQKLDHLSFSEAVERLAARAGMELTVEDGDNTNRGPSKTRLYAAAKAAADFYVSQLGTPAGRQAVDFMAARGFDAPALKQFGVGYSPNSWDGLIKHLTGLGFNRVEMLAAGLVKEGNRGVYDAFRGRIMWPIRDASGQVVGFGARKLLESDQGPKYLNSSDSAIYHKSQLLYGIDLAKRAIGQDKRVIIVEGYTDVMACHLAGVPHAIATCGTAFGADHIAVLRRMLGDSPGAEVIFTFDPDAAGQNAALKAFGQEQKFVAQTYAVVNAEGLDPSDMRQHRGDAALAEMFNQRVPLFEFAMRQVIRDFDLNTVEGRVGALRKAAPVVAGIRDSALRPGYVRELSGLLGLDIAEVQRAVNGSASSNTAGGSEPPAPALPAQPVQQVPRLAQLPHTGDTRLERDAMMAMLQHPDLIGEQLLTQAVTARVDLAPLAGIRDAIAQTLSVLTSGAGSGSNSEPGSGVDAASQQAAAETRSSQTAAVLANSPQWLQLVLQNTPEPLRDLLRELAIAPLQQTRPDRLPGYCRDIVVALLDRDLRSLKREMMLRMLRIGDATHPQSLAYQQQMDMIERARRSLRPENQ